MTPAVTVASASVPGDAKGGSPPWLRKDLLSIEELSREEIEFLLDSTDSFKEVSSRQVKKVPALQGKTIANFWPYATTIFDFTRRALPWLQPRTLTDNEVYALTAYLLAINNIIDDGDVMNAETLPQVQMPNRNGFIPRFPDRIP